MFHSDNTHFPKNYIMTVGADLYVKPIIIPDTNYTVELYLFDCAGEDVYRDLIAKYMYGAAMIALVYDVTNKNSYDHLDAWFSIVKSNWHKCKEFISDDPSLQPPSKSKINKDVQDDITVKPIQGVLIGNKIDLSNRVVVKSHMGHTFAQDNNLAFFETSALAGKDTDAPFNYIANSFYESYLEKLKQFSK
eukprot:TRINITY_DN2643_c0_g1_i1.p1 TRINITY_DN2643_c0_g1~~TRINITY_DN2643_c0_g1_i1.p1  ORF type:complete len:221 (-),score=43.55 TRINITY_DN2643_c0_g1_i1:23-595(-)